MLTLEKFSIEWRPLRASGQGATDSCVMAGSPASPSSRLEQVESRAPHRRFEPGSVKAAPMPPSVNSAGTSYTWMPITSTWARRSLHRGQRFLHAGRRLGHRSARPAADVEAFVGRHPELIGRLSVPGIAAPFATTRIGRSGCRKYLFPSGSRPHLRHVAERKGADISHGSLHGRNRLAADSSRAARHSPAIADEKIPSRPLRPSSPAASTRRGLRWRPRAV